ncbi:uncharacterized protein VTP21DRAFT_468 [Calcarisporiella thermophila]|uniref:uncharacterized protein n=1 Tax=Calcarisporiella thermophila TaxID=911321 RepID=UPI0037422994
MIDEAYCVYWQTTATNQTKKIYSLEEWEKKLGEIELNKQDLDRLVMNYLLIEGYKDAAEKFSAESGLEPQIDLRSVQERTEIRNAVYSGNIEEAIEKVNDLDPEILDTNPKLYFHLKQQLLIEKIRKGQITEALEFAQEELAPRGEENPEFLEELERTMALLIFDNNSSSPVSNLLGAAHRQRTASELNAAILVAQSQEKEPKLPNMIKMLHWCEAQLDERKVMYPKIRDFSTGELHLESKEDIGSTT